MARTVRFPESKKRADYAPSAKFDAPFLGMQRFLSFLLDQNGAAR